MSVTRKHPGYCVTVSETAITTDGCPIWEDLPTHWKALCDWLAQHGIDSREVMLRTTIVRNLDQRQVTYTGFRRITPRVIMLPAAADGAPSLEDLEQGVDLSEHLLPEIEPVTRAVQLEAPPMPFPSELTDGSGAPGVARGA